MEDFLQIGVISSTHGIKGEVKVFPTTDDVNRFKKLKEVYLDTGREMLTLHPESVKFFKQFVIIKFKEFNSINEVEAYRNKSLLVDRVNAVKLRKDEYFIADLIGLKVITDEEKEILLFYLAERSRHELYELTGLTVEEYAALIG